ncbi:MAG: cell surface protein SprA [Crocinitomicaceae bacterium]|nr:cell surface protein SprA [Crocinitomicaceae bacterium]
MKLIFTISAIALAGFQILAQTPVKDTTKLQYPIYDYYDYTQQQNTPINLADPDNINTEIVYNPTTGEYEIYQKIGGLYYRYPTSMTMDEYLEYQRKKALNDYFREKVDENNEQQRGALIPPIKMESEAFDIIFGGDEINIRPQGSAELSFGVNISRYDNPVLPVKQRRVATFDFQQKINLNLVGQIGDKLKLTIQQNTEATFNFENVVKIEYTGYEDEIIQKIEAGNVSLPLNSTLIQGSSSLFGIRTDLKFGPLTVQTILSQQRGKQQEINVTGGAQIQDYEVFADNYEANKHYFLNYYHRDHYDTAMQTMPIVNSGVNITKIEVWITNRINKVENTRNIIGFTDLGETKPEYCEGNPIQFNGQFPDNDANELYGTLAGAAPVREFSNAVQYLSSVTGIPGPFVQSQHYEKVENARQLSEQEFTYNSQLGFVSLKSPLNQDEVLAVAYQYTYAGRTFQVGEFTTDVPVAEGSKSALILKLLKPTIVNPKNKTWDLMMKNVYSIGAYQVSQADFIMDIWYNNPMSSTDINYLPYEGVDNKLLMQQLDLDRLNLNNGLSSDGRFDYVPIQYDNNRAINGGTIDPKTGRLFFTTIEPFGKTLSEKLEDQSTLAPSQIESIVFQELYDSTKTAAQQIPGKNRFKLKGSYKSSVSSEISLNALNIPEGSVIVTAGGRVLTEGIDYTVDYNLGRVKILDQGLLEAQTPISVKLESNSVFGFQSKSMVGAHFNYEFNKDFNVGATVLNLTEKPLTQKVNIGDEPISNTVIGTDVRYRSEFPFLTKAVDYLPVISTKEKSYITANGEFAYLIPGTQRAISKEGISYIDGFEGSQSAIDIKAFQSWKLASIPQGQPSLFPEAGTPGLNSGYGRAHISWYVVDPTAFYQNSSTTPDHIADNLEILDNSQMHMLQQQQLFPQFQPQQGTLNNIPVFDLAYFPSERGPYNYDTTAAYINSEGEFTNPEDRWAGIMRSLTTTNFETANIQFIQFWILDPFNNDATDSGTVNMSGGDLYFNLGNISEDILPDSRKSFENGMPASATFDPNDYDTTDWAAVPNQQVIVNAFDNSTSSRVFQDVGLDGMDNAAERAHFAEFITWVNASGLSPAAKQKLLEDPSGDSYNYYLDDNYDALQLDIIERYKYYNGTEGNSPTAEMSDTMNAAGYPTSGPPTPDIEDLNQDNNLSETESYFQYKVSLRPGDLVEGENYITNSQVVDVGESGKTETWYQFKIPINDPDLVVNGISDFRSIRFMRMYVAGFDHPVVLRFAKLELIRGEWRMYMNNIDEPGEVIQDDPNTTEFNIGAVNLEENNQRQPVNYNLPPGIQRQQDNASINFRQLNEQSLSLQVCGLKDGEARSAYKNVTFDVRSYKQLEMFVHAEARNVESGLQDDQLTVFIRLGTDFENNYYEYEMPVKVTAWGTLAADDYGIWPEANNMKIILSELTNLKMERNANGISSAIEYIKTLPADALTGVISRIKLKGNPNLQGMKVIMIGVRNPGKNTNHPWMNAEDGLDKCAEIWVNELRLTDFDQQGGWASTARVSLQLADFANVNVAGAYSTPGWGSIEKKVSERQRDTQKSFDFSTSVELGQFLGTKARVQVPFLYGYSVAAVDPQFDLLAPDIRLADYDLATRQQRAELSRDVTIRRYYNFTNVRRERPAGKEVHFWDVENWSATYSYNELYMRDINTDHNLTQTYRGALNYSFSGKPIAVEPFKNVGFVKKSKWFGLLKEFNFYLGPKSVAFSSDITRMYNERQNRNILDTNFVFQPTYLKNFTWQRTYDVKYDVTKQLKFTFTAINNSIIYEPDGVINPNATAGSDDHTKYLLYRDGLSKAFNPFSTAADTVNRFGGYTLNYGHNYNITYKLPFSQLPLTDWLTVNVKYRGSYDWMRAPIAQPAFGHTIQNSSNFNINGQADFNKIYNRLEFFRRVNGGKPSRTGRTNERTDGSDGKTPEDGKEEKPEEKEKDKKEKGELHPAWKVVGQMIMTVQSASLTYSETDGMLLPGFNNATTLFGMNNFGAPGFAFASGQQNTDLWGRPTDAWGENSTFAPYAAANGWLVQNPSLNVQHTVSHTQTINGKIVLMPIKDLTINLSLDRKYTNNENGYYRYNDTLVTSSGIGYWDYQNQVNMGSLSFSTITWKTSFGKMDSTYFSETFNDMRNYRQNVSEQLGLAAGTAEQTDGFYQGFGNNQQDVLIGSFFAAYTGKGTGNTFFDVFKAIPLPNWDVRYNGLSKFKFMKDLVRNFTISHAYRSSVSVSNFQTNLAAFDPYGVQQLDVSGNYIPGRQIQSVIITEQVQFGLDATWTIRDNGLITKFEYSKDRTVALNIPNLQVMEMRGWEIVIGSGYKFTALKLPFKFMGKTPESDLNIRFDLNIRNNISVARNVIEDTNQPTAGTKTYSLKFRVDYNLGANLNCAFYFDRVVNTPVLSNAYPTANTSCGIALRFNLAQ